MVCVNLQWKEQAQEAAGGRCNESQQEEFFPLERWGLEGVGHGARASGTCLGVLDGTNTDGVDSVGGSIVLKHWAGHSGPIQESLHN